MTRSTWIWVAIPMLALAACAGTMNQAPPRQLSLGKDSDGDRCDAIETRKDASASGLFDISYSITCRKVTASRSLGFIRSVPRDSPAVAAIEASLSCGASTQKPVPGVGPVEARRCYDKGLGSEAVVLSFERGGRRIVGSSTPSSVGPMEMGMRQLAGAGWGDASPEGSAPVSIDFAGLAPPPQQATSSTAGEAYFDPEVDLRRGIDLNLKGLHSEASRVLNDALSRMPDSAPARTKAELSLEAGLADSNISFGEAAAEHFMRADAYIAAQGAGVDPLLLRKREIYRALDFLNRRDFRAALTALDQLVTPSRMVGKPLEDPSILRRVNQAGTARDVSSIAAIPDQAMLRQLALDAQANWARSVAMFALGDRAGSERALAAADSAYTTLSRERIEQGQILWIGARIERQRGRLAASRSDWTQAVASFDKALEQLRQSSVATAGTGNEPAIAETQLERASIIAQRGDAPEAVRREYDLAIDTMIASDIVGSGIPRGYDRYLDLLVSEGGAGASEETSELFFRAIQAVGEPALARQVSSLQNVVGADPKLGVMLRDRADLERELTALRYQISAADPARATELEARRQAAEQRLLALQGQLASDRRYSSINDRPATVADLRAALRPGELFLKISTLDRSAYGIVIAADRSYIYKIERPTDDLDKLSGAVRATIDGELDRSGQIVPYSVIGAYNLFKLIAGPAAERLASASAIVIDPSGPLERLPLSVLVADQASVDRFRQKRGQEKFDTSDVAFIAKTAAISTAVSPRSFLVARSLPASRATKPFIGFAEHQPPATGPQFASAAPIEVGNVCSAEAQSLREFASRWDPIDRSELQIAATALGDPSAPMVTGAEFTDTAVEARTDLDQYQVLHFATHGLQEGQWGCDKSPPALITTFGDMNSDGLLSFSEVAGLRLDANLVVLSACDTGSGVKSQALARQSGQEEAGATLEGLVRAFLTANTRAVLATHWRVPASEGTPEFIRAFYSTARSKPMGDALQTAQRELIASPEYSHPFYWGAYFVVGDAGKMMLSAPPAGAGAH